MWLKGRVTIAIGASPDKSSQYKFGVHRNCSSGDMMVLVYHVIWQDFAIKGSSDLQVGAHQVKLGGHRLSGSGDIMVFVFHVTLQDSVLNGFMIRSPSNFVTILPSLVAIGIVVIKIRWFSFVT